MELAPQDLGRMDLSGIGDVARFQALTRAVNAGYDQLWRQAYSRSLTAVYPEHDPEVGWEGRIFQPKAIEIRRRDLQKRLGPTTDQVVVGQAHGETLNPDNGGFIVSFPFSAPYSYSHYFLGGFAPSDLRALCEHIRDQFNALDGGSNIAVELNEGVLAGASDGIRARWQIAEAPFQVEYVHQVSPLDYFLYTNQTFHKDGANNGEQNPYVLRSQGYNYLFHRLPPEIQPAAADSLVSSLAGYVNVRSIVQGFRGFMGRARSG